MLYCSGLLATCFLPAASLLLSWSYRIFTDSQTHSVYIPDVPWKAMEAMIFLNPISWNHGTEGARVHFCVLVRLCSVISISRTSLHIHSSLALTSVDALFCSPDWRTSALINTWEGWHFQRASILSCLEHFASLNEASQTGIPASSSLWSLFFYWHLHFPGMFAEKNSIAVHFKWGTFA